MRSRGRKEARSAGSACASASGGVSQTAAPGRRRREAQGDGRFAGRPAGQCESCTVSATPRARQGVASWRVGGPFLHWAGKEALLFARGTEGRRCCCGERDLGASALQRSTFWKKANLHQHAAVAVKLLMMCAYGQAKSGKIGSFAVVGGGISHCLQPEASSGGHPVNGLTHCRNEVNRLFDHLRIDWPPGTRIARIDICLVSNLVAAIHQEVNSRFHILWLIV